MKEIPKYTVPTYNPHSFAYNERSDFTRRIPTGLSDKQMARDAKIAGQIIRAWDDGEPEIVLDIFFKKSKWLSNPRYWELMRTVWVAAGSTETSEVFRMMMKSQRPCQTWFMTPEDAEFLNSLEFPVMVWRAWDKNIYGDNDPGIAWTLDSKWCVEYAKSKGREVKWRTVRRDEVFAYISRRGESEMIIL